MTALAKDRNTHRRDDVEHEGPVAASKLIYAGALLVRDTSGNIEPGTTATGKIAIGRALEQVDNSSGIAGAKNVRYESGCFKWANGGAITKANIGDPCYIVDDQTVHETATGRSAAGIIVDVDTDGVWVQMGAIVAAPSVGLLAANNLSDLGTLATAIANLGLQDGSTDVDFDDIVGDKITLTELATLGAGAKLDANAAAPEIHCDVVTVTATQIRNLAAAPKELVAAPGATKALVFRGALVSYRGGSNAFDSVGAGEDLAVRYENGSGALCSAALDTTTDINFGATTDANATLAKLATTVIVPLNKSLVLDNIGGGELAAADDDANGDGIVTVVIEYEVHTVVA